MGILGLMGLMGLLGVLGFWAVPFGKPRRLSQEAVVCAK